MANKVWYTVVIATEEQNVSVYPTDTFCNHDYILTSEQNHRVIKCSKCDDTKPI
jgi:hypothetical protein